MEEERRKGMTVLECREIREMKENGIEVFYCTSQFCKSSATWRQKAVSTQAREQKRESFSHVFPLSIIMT